jgi:Cu/Ag efflux protein CusF
MKSKAAVVAALLAFAAAGAVHAQGMKGMESKEAKGEVHRATGVVTRVDKEKVVIKHDPVASLNWPVMTMAFVARDPKVLEKMKPGAKVDFGFTKSGKDYVITDVK